ncbi:MAG: hypothetical protein Q4D61_04255 [Cardiobacteriaceae bacterium]|nr:hypothetical protein [Cardiobacteriaceae bacterium]
MKILHPLITALALFASHTFAQSDTPQAALDTYFREAMHGDSQIAAKLLYTNDNRLKLQGLNGRAAPPWDIFRLLQLGPFSTKNGFYEAYADYLQSSRGQGFAIENITVKETKALTAPPAQWLAANEGEMLKADVAITLRHPDGRTESVPRTLALIRTADGWRILQYL